MNDAATADAANAIMSSRKRRPGVPVVARPSSINIDVKQIRLTGVRLRRHTHNNFCSSSTLY
jgi:hypothetical protein